MINIRYIKRKEGIFFLFFSFFPLNERKEQKTQKNAEGESYTKEASLKHDKLESSKSY